jgi:hypothetical protein
MHAINYIFIFSKLVLYAFCKGGVENLSKQNLMLILKNKRFHRFGIFQENFDGNP